MAVEMGFKALSGVRLHFTFGMRLSKACLSLLFFPDVEDKGDVMVKEVVMSFADSSCLV